MSRSQDFFAMFFVTHGPGIYQQLSLYFSRSPNILIFLLLSIYFQLPMVQLAIFQQILHLNKTENWSAVSCAVNPAETYQ